MNYEETQKQTNDLRRKLNHLNREKLLDKVLNIYDKNISCLSEMFSRDEIEQILPENLIEIIIMESSPSTQFSEMMKRQLYSLLVTLMTQKTKEEIEEEAQDRKKLVGDNRYKFSKRSMSANVPENFSTETLQQASQECRLFYEDYKSANDFVFSTQLNNDDIYRLVNEELFVHPSSKCLYLPLGEFLLNIRDLEHANSYLKNLRRYDYIAFDEYNKKILTTEYKKACFNNLISQRKEKNRKTILNFTEVSDEEIEDIKKKDRADESAA